MNKVRTEIVHLTYEEVEQAMRAYVRAKGLAVTRHSQVSGLSKLSTAKHSVSVQISSVNEEVT